MNVAVIVAPLFDEATKYSYEWSRQVKRMLELYNYEVIDIGGREVSKREVEDTLKKHPYAIYIHYNHGSEDKHWGSSTEAVVSLENVDLLAGRDVYTMNCLSAKKLGVEAWRRGAKAYWGYVEEFAFSTEAVEAFGEFANCGLRFRLEGKSWSECLEYAKKLANEIAEKLVSNGAYFAAILIKHDAEALHCWNGETPPSTCTLRKLSIKLFGKKLGWRISRKHALSLLLFGCGLGVYIHDRWVEWVKASTYLGRVHGLDVGFILIVVAYVIVTLDFVKWLKK